MRVVAISLLLSASACGSGSAGSSGGSAADSGPVAAGGDASAGGDDAGGPVDSGAIDPTGDAISVQPPVDDADTPPTEAGPGGPWIAFASSRAGSFDLYLVHDDGTALRPLVQGPGQDLFPSWSPDGARVAFSSDRGTDGGGDQLFIVDVASGIITPVATGLTYGVSPAWSPDGSTFAFGGPGGLYVVAASGGTAKSLTTGSFRDNSPAWAPDGSVIFFSSNRGAGGTFDVWSVKPDGTGLQQVTTGTGILGGPAVSPDGATIAFTQSGAASGAGVSTVVALFTRATKAITTFSALGDYEPSFAPSGAKMVVTSTRYGDANPEVVVLAVPGASSPFRLTNDPGVDGQGAFQPVH